MNDKLERLKNRIGEISDIGSAISLLHWDQQTYMPPKGAMARGEQISTLSAIAHRMFIDPEVGQLLETLSESLDNLSPDDVKYVEETLYDYRRATQLPEDFVRDLSELESQAFHAWHEAKEENDFSKFRPFLEKIVEFELRKVDLLGFEDHPYDTLLEDYERGMKTSVIQETFSHLARHQSKLVERIVDSPNQPDIGWTRQDWNCQAQWDFGMKVLADIGFDLEAGRQDKSAHPFTTEFDLYDVRITTRMDEQDLFSALSSTIHEAGHGLYEQGLREEDRRGTLGQACSLGMHESQSRMWENMIGRSLPFWNHYAPELKKLFPAQLAHIGPDRIYRANNHVERSLIRVEADECTYNLHIILRFEIELGLVERRFKVSEVPEIWNAKMKDYLGLEVPDDAHGCLQDIHWSSACFGYFPTYSLGNLYAAQLFEKILEDIPDLWSQVEQGNFSPLLRWLREKIHRVGRRATAPEIVRQVTGKQPGSEAYLRYLETKYGEIYGLD
jgi:carboxypeptidase Taq